MSVKYCSRDTGEAAIARARAGEHGLRSCGLFNHRSRYHEKPIYFFTVCMLEPKWQRVVTILAVHTQVRAPEVRR